MTDARAVERRVDLLMSRFLLLSLLSTLLFIQALRAFFSSVYYVNLVTLSLNASALYTLLVLSPALYLFLRNPNVGRMMVLAAVALVVLRLAMNLSWGTTVYLPVSGLAVASYLALLPAMLAASKAVHEEGWVAIGLGIVLALALDSAVGLLGASRDISTGPIGLYFTAPVGAFLVYVAFVSRPPAGWEARDEELPRWKTVLAGLAFGALLFLEYAILSSAYSVARWNALPLVTVALGAVLGLLVPVASTIRPLRPPGRSLPMALLSGVTLAALFDHVLTHSVFLPALLLVGQVTLVLILLHLLSFLHKGGVRRTAVALVYGSLLLLLLLFSLAFALAYAYVPLRGLWEGLEVVLIPAASLLVILAAAAITGGFREPLRIPSLPRGLLAVLIVLPLIISTMSLVPAPVDEREGTTLRFLTYNIHQGFNNAGVIDPEVFVEVIESTDADVVALQESDTARFTSANLDIVGYLATRFGYHSYYGPPTWEQSFGIALLSRYPIREASYSLLSSSEDKRALIQARIAVDGWDVWVFVTHLALGAADRGTQAREILARAASAGGLQILAGDFNSCPGGRCPGYAGPEDSVYAEINASLRDVWVEGGYEVDDPEGYTYSAAIPNERIDYIFISAGIDVEAVERIRTEAAIRASDHLPVLATLQIVG